MSDFVAESENVFIMAVAATFTISFIVFAVCSTLQRLSKERTRREMMAYLAEGSITAEDVCRMMEAQDMEEMRCKLAEAVSEGTIKAADLASIVRPQSA